MAELSTIQTVESEPGYGQLIAVLVRRRAWLLGVFLGALSAAAALTFLIKPTYQSSMQLLVEPNYQGKKGEAGSDLQFADSTVEVDISTQLTLMRSSQLLQRAVDLLHAKYPNLDVKDLQDSLNLIQVEDDKVKTKIFQVVYTDTDPDKTQDVLKAIQKVYQDYNRQQQQLRLASGLKFINEQLPEIQDEVNKSEEALEQFRKNQNLIDPELQSKALVDSLTAVREERRKNQAQMRETQAQYAALQQQLNRSRPETLVTARLSQSERYQTLLNEIQKTELALAQQRDRFTDNSPIVQKLLQQQADQEALLQQEAQRVLGDTSQQIPSGDRLMKEGQLGDNDLTLASQLVTAQVNLQALQGREQSLAQTEETLNAQLKRFPRLLAEYGRLQPNVQINRDTYQELLKAKQELGLEIARGGFDWQVVEQPKLGYKVSPSLKRNLVLGAIAGLMVGCVAAFAREAIDDAVHTSDDLKKQVAMPLLGMVPALPHTDVNGSAMHLPFRKPQVLVPMATSVIHWVPFREALDLIYKNIQLLNSDFPLRSLVVTSALAGEGKSTFALGLAMSAARLHQRVLLIDADLRRPSLHKLLNLPNERGLSTLLAGESSIPIQSNVQSSALYDNISVLTSGPTPSDPVKLLSSRRMGELMSVFEKTYDLVLLDVPPVLGIVDSILTASFCDGVVLVGRIGQVTRTELTQATAMLNKLNVIGVIANGANRSTSSYAAYERSNTLTS
jgi:capsular exopolysaccharide synthesis family protein